MSVKMNSFLGMLACGSFASTATLRISRKTLPRSVLCPHSALLTELTIASRDPLSTGTRCHVGLLEKVSSRPRKGSSVSCDTRIPSAIDTSIGVPSIDPETSLSAITLRRQPSLRMPSTRDFQRASIVLASPPSPWPGGLRVPHISHIPAASGLLNEHLGQPHCPSGAWAPSRRR